MEQMPLVSVIVPVYKVEEYLPKCVESLLAQTCTDLEIILVDDGSPDQCGEICDRYAAQDSRIKVIHKQNGGLSSARNAGIDIARGKYIGFVDSDDWIEPETYALMTQAAEKEHVKLVCAGRYDVSGRTGERKVGLCPPKEEVISGEELVRRIFTWNQIDSAAGDKLYARELFREIRYPLGKIVEDVPTTYRIALDAGKAAMLPVPVYNYYHRPNSITTSAISDKTFHFPDHTEQIYARICDGYPQLEKEAGYLRLRSLFFTVQRFELAGDADRKKYAEEYRTLKSQLWELLQSQWRNPYLPKKERREAFLMAAGLYRPLRQIYHLAKKA